MKLTFSSAVKYSFIFLIITCFSFLAHPEGHHFNLIPSKTGVINAYYPLPAGSQEQNAVQIIEKQLFCSNQTAKDSSEVLKYLGHWISFFVNYSNYDLSNSLNLKAFFGKLGELAGENLEINANFELSEMLESFRRNTFIHVYPVPIINREEAAFERLNQLMMGWHKPMASPYLSLFVYLDPVPGGKFSIKFQIRPSENMGGIETAVVAEMNRQMTEVYTSVGESKEKVNRVISEALQQLEEQVKSQYFPDITIWYDGSPYGTGHQVEMWEGTTETQLYAAKKKTGSNGELTFNIIPGMWQGPNLQSNGIFAYYTPVPGTFPLKFSLNDQTVEIKVKVKEGTGVPSLRSVLKALVREVALEIQANAVDSLERLNGHLSRFENNINNSRDRLNSQSPSLGVASNAREYHSTNESIEFYSLDAGSSEEGIAIEDETVDDLVKYQIAYSRINAIIEWTKMLQGFTTKLIDDPKTMDAFLGELLTNSGRLLARFTLTSLGAAEKQEVKVLLKGYLQENIIQFSKEY